ncbi:MAG: sigma 54-interacting transcriptional regulator [Kofleriaceae bacterium]|nr:sigma 54-interacting transcriptional regulator [Kofleriaceae bacterium]MBP9168715.1 sigma 54-interacting transcriptional regulator [Kofleriaceae bacterium]MBP9862411.1 sigma 54-interacting transcriptional regulator [Kofleriaceae bacterium]
MNETLSDSLRSRPAPPDGARAVTALYVLLDAGRPLGPSSRHELEGVDRIELGRGERGAWRTTLDGRSDLRVAVPDPRMSAVHGHLTRVGDRWVFQDAGSKNGATVDGEPVRCAAVAPGALLGLGHTFFLLADEEVVGVRPADQTSDELAAPSPALASFDDRLRRHADELAAVARSMVPVVLGGETGTGKEVYARALHALSGRRGAFVAVHCGGLAAQLVEAELFGHRRGAFSGATEERPGYVRAADRGTLFLDEIGELPPPAQTALLRVLQERAVVPVGESHAVPVDFRLCVATHRDLEALVELGQFRADLHARLLGVAIELTPLRERRGDLGLLIARLLERVGGAGLALTPAAALALLRHRWLLNVRELERTLAAAVARAGAGPIDVGHLPPGLAIHGGPPGARPVATIAARSRRDDGLRASLVEALSRHDGNVTAVARDLGKHREQIHRWLRRLAIDPAQFRG